MIRKVTVIQYRRSATTTATGTRGGYDKQEWLGAPRAGEYPLHLISNQPRTRLHSQLDHGTTSRRAKIKDREAARMHPDDAAARNISEGDVIRLFNDRGACLAGVQITDALRPGVIELATGAWYDPLDPQAAQSLDVHGNPNVLTRDAGTSKLGQGSTAHSCLVEVERFDGLLPPVKAFTQPATVEDRTTMIRQITLIKFKPDTTGAEIGALGEGFKELANVVPGIRRFEFGPDLKLESNTLDYALVIDFASVDDWKAYREHPITSLSPRLLYRESNGLNGFSTHFSVLSRCNPRRGWLCRWNSVDFRYCIFAVYRAVYIAACRIPQRRSHKMDGKCGKSKKTILKVACAAALLLASSATMAERVAIGEFKYANYQAIMHLIKALVEDRLGGEVEIVPANNAMMYAGMDRGKGEIDVHADVWIPNQRDFYEEYVVRRGTVAYSEHSYAATTGFCVPKYFAEEQNLTSVFDLARPEIAAMLDSDGNGKGEIWIGLPGSAQVAINHVKVRDYGLLISNERVEADFAVNYAALDDAVRKHKGYAFFCWAPDGVWLLHDLCAVGGASARSLLCKDGTTERRSRLAGKIEDHLRRCDQAGPDRLFEKPPGALSDDRVAAPGHCARYGNGERVGFRDRLEEARSGRSHERMDREQPGTSR